MRKYEVVAQLLLLRPSGAKFRGNSLRRLIDGSGAETVLLPVDDAVGVCA